MRPRRAGIIGLMSMVGLGAGVLAARAHQALVVEEVPPPPPSPPPSEYEKSLMMVASWMKPFRPPPPLELGIPQAEAKAQILEELRQICLLLKPGKLTAQEVAARLGTVLEDDHDSSLQFRPRSRYFNLGTISYYPEDEGYLPLQPDLVALYLVDPRLLTRSMVLEAFGPEETDGAAWTGGVPVFAAFAKQPRTGQRCEFLAATYDGEDYGVEEPVVRHILIEVWPKE